MEGNVLEFAKVLPLNSQGEAAPSDKDPIPLPFDNTYNQPERDHFHTKAKYYRTDPFLVEHMLDDATRTQLDQAWNDLLASFEYYDVFLRFTSDKYQAESEEEHRGTRRRGHRGACRRSRGSTSRHSAPITWQCRKPRLAARPGHVEDCLQFASKAWRRPLTETEKDRLRAFYVKSTETGKLDHGKAIETLIGPHSGLARISLPTGAARERLEHEAAIGLGNRQPAELFPVVVGSG